MRSVRSSQTTIMSWPYILDIFLGVTIVDRKIIFSLSALTSAWRALNWISPSFVQPQNNFAPYRFCMYFPKSLSSFSPSHFFHYHIWLHSCIIPDQLLTMFSNNIQKMQKLHQMQLSFLTLLVLYNQLSKLLFQQIWRGNFHKHMKLSHFLCSASFPLKTEDVLPLVNLFMQ